jgi:hypothetical protein
MTTWTSISLTLAAIITLIAAAAWRAIRRRNMHLWLASQLRQSFSRRGVKPGQPIDVFICIADHFEPNWGGADAATADARVEAWITQYPFALGCFKDSDGRPPRHTFFYPIDEYEPRHVDAIAGLCRRGYGEIEIHLHHDNDTPENLRNTLDRFTRVFSEKHDVLGRWSDGRPAFGFVHGNWALDNSRPDGRWCGVANELKVLEEAGCYADFTLPSAPDATQTRTINSIYYAKGKDGCCKSHNQGVPMRAGTPAPDGLPIIQGPLRLFWSKSSRRPRLENGCIQHGQPATMERLDQWIRAAVRVEGKPNWFFVKLHTHGAKAENRGVLLGKSGVEFHAALAERARRDPCFRYHYVTAREMFNLAKAAENSEEVAVTGSLDFEIAPPSPHNAENRLLRAE